MRKIEPLVALGVWTLLGIAVEGIGYTQAAWPLSIEKEELGIRRERKEESGIQRTGNEQEETPETESEEGEVSGRESEEEETLRGDEEEHETQRTQTEEREETESELETQERENTETQEETEISPIVISDIQLVRKERYYDGTTQIELEATAENVPDNMTLTVYGETQKADAGIWPVQVYAELEGEGSENYSIEICQEELMATILPRPLYLTISNGRKPYYSENVLENVIFEEEIPIRVSGFLECDCKEKEVPEGFVFPELELDEEVLQKDSPMYENGKEICYRHAVTVKKQEDGSISGNPTANYTFGSYHDNNIEEKDIGKKEEVYVEGGDILLVAAPVIGTLDYTLQCSDVDGMAQDNQGRLWVRSGESLQVVPTSHSGYTDGEIIGQVHGSGVAEFFLTRKNSQGEVVARSQIRSVSWHADGQAPETSFFINGNPVNQTEPFYTNQDAEVSCGEIKDRESGLKKVEMYVDYETDQESSGEELYSRYQKDWQKGAKISLEKEGSAKVWVRMEDRVGNVSYQCSNEMILDMKGPEINFSEIVPGSANSQKVEPVCMVQDDNLDADSLEVLLTGYHNKTCQVSWDRRRKENGTEVVLKMKNLPEKREWDDVYELQVKAVDQAGNASSSKISFSVNRFGSVYYLDENTRRKTERIYLTEPSEIKIHEVNVDYLTESRILLGYEGETRKLEKSQDYTVRKTGNDNTWKEYCYTISPDCFQKEGWYYLLCASEDRAENLSDNRMRKQKIEFAIDKSSPRILLTGIEDGQKYAGKRRLVDLECLDNLALRQVTVWINGKEQIQNAKEEQQIELTELETWQTIRILAEDKAGNREDTGDLYFWLNDRKEAVPLNKEKIAAERKREIWKGQEETEERWQKVSQMDQEEQKEQDHQRKDTSRRNRKILSVLAVSAVLWAIFLARKRHK